MKSSPSLEPFNWHLSYIEKAQWIPTKHTSNKINNEAEAAVLVKLSSVSICSFTKRQLVSKSHLFYIQTATAPISIFTAFDRLPSSQIELIKRFDKHYVLCAMAGSKNNLNWIRIHRYVDYYRYFMELGWSITVTASVYDCFTIFVFWFLFHLFSLTVSIYHTLNAYYGIDSRCITLLYHINRWAQ